MARNRLPRAGLRSARASLALGAVGVLAGMLFATNAGLFAQASDRQPQDLRDLVRDESARMQEVATEVTELRSEVEELVTLQESLNPGATHRPEVELAAGRTAVQGPGIQVELWDAPYHEVPEGFSPDDLVVHQQDIEAVLNGLRAGGAEAIAVQGHRVTATTSIRCVGNVLLLDGHTYSPPYVITAIGDPGELQDAVFSQPSVQIYLQYVDAVRLGWSLEVEETIEIPGFEGNLTLEYAQVPGHEPYVPSDEDTATPFQIPEPQ